jgi:ribosomal protein S15P/S13E
MPKKSPEKSEKNAEETENEAEKQSKKEKEPAKISESEYEKKVIALAEKGLTSEKIGEELKKQNIHSKEYSKKISVILKAKNLYVSPDSKNVQEKLNRITAHTQKNVQDKKAKREKDRVFSQLRKINKYAVK